MRGLVKKILARYGQQLVLENGEGQVAFRGIFQHTGSKDWHNMEKSYGLLGQIPRGQYMVLAPAGVRLQQGDRLLTGERRFVLRRVETVLWKEETLYCWGLCVEIGKEDTWPA